MIYETMPFGKYKGEKLYNLPSTYIVYALDEFDLPDELNTALCDQLKYRYGLFDSDISKDASKAFRELSKKYHPDKGGSDMAMIAILEFKNMLS